MRRRLALVGACLLVACAVGVAAFFALRSEPKRELGVVPRPPLPVADFAVRVALGRFVVLHSSPGGPVVGRVRDTTEFGSPQVLDPVARRSGWLEIRHPSLGNGHTAWIDRRSPISLRRRRVGLEVDLSRRLLLVREAGRVERKISVAIGAPHTRTPAGEFYVTDKLPGERFGSYYGCCILALSGRQPNLPRGWSGGDRLAIHGSPTPTEGKAVSNGCLHAHERDLRYLMRVVPLGAAVQIHA